MCTGLSAAGLSRQKKLSVGGNLMCLCSKTGGVCPECIFIFMSWSIIAPCVDTLRPDKQNTDHHRLMIAQFSAAPVNAESAPPNRKPLIWGFSAETAVGGIATSHVTSDEKHEEAQMASGARFTDWEAI